MGAGESAVSKMSPPFTLGVAVDWPVAAAAPPFPEHSYSHLCELAAAHGFRAFLFSIGAIDWQRGRTLAWLRSGSHAPWQKKLVPLPDAVYNRISKRRSESLTACRRALARLSKTSPLFNPRFLDKAEVQEALGSSPAAEHLPPASVAAGAEEIAEAIARFQAAYVKPAAGSCGAGILRAEKAGQVYRIAYNARRGGPAPVRRARVGRSGLIAALKSLYRGERVLVQQAVTGQTYRGRPFDLRLLVQKDPAGLWRLTAAAGRIAAPSGLTTHTLRGGSRTAYAALAEELGGRIPGLDILEDVSRKAACAIEAACGAAFFEFSLDVAVSPCGRPAILEVNAKPFPFDEPEIRRLAAERLFAYARERILTAGKTA